MIYKTLFNKITWPLMSGSAQLETMSEKGTINNRPRYIFLGMWHEYNIHQDLKTILLPPGINDWQEITINQFMRTRQSIDLIICGPFKCDKTLYILTKFRKQLQGIPKLLINGENPITYTRRNYLWPCIKLVNYVIDFTRHTPNTNPDCPLNLNSIQFPIWLWNDLEPTQDGIHWNPLNNPVSRLNLGWKRKFENKYLASCVAGHDRNNTRLPIIQELQKYGQVICPGKLISNCPPIAHGYPAKIKFIAESRFNICTENSAGPGYFTEKIFNSLEAGCTPIYWCGSKQRPIWVNPAAYIYLPDLDQSTISQLIKTAIDSPRPQLLPGLENTPLTPTAEWEIADCYYQLKFLFQYPVILKKPLPLVFHFESATQVIAELPKAELGTQFTWGPENITNNIPGEWKYLNWTGISIPDTVITGLETPSTIIGIISSSHSGIIHKNYFTSQLII